MARDCPSTRLLVLSVRIGSNIDHVDGETLADFAIASACAPAGARREDGITYLVDTKKQGIETPLLPPYEKAVLHRLPRVEEVSWPSSHSNRGGQPCSATARTS